MRKTLDPLLVELTTTRCEAASPNDGLGPRKQASKQASKHPTPACVRTSWHPSFTSLLSPLSSLIISLASRPRSFLLLCSRPTPRYGPTAAHHASPAGVARSQSSHLASRITSHLPHSLSRYIHCTLLVCHHPRIKSWQARSKAVSCSFDHHYHHRTVAWRQRVRAEAGRASSHVRASASTAPASLFLSSLDPRPPFFSSSLNQPRRDSLLPYHLSRALYKKSTLLSSGAKRLGRKHDRGIKWRVRSRA